MTNQVPKSKKNAIEIDKDNPFKNCKLGREKYAQVLTSIIQNYSDGFVLAINNEWGTGKTTFIKMWEQYLKNKPFEFTTLHFNAWKTDFSSNPFLALISQLKILDSSKTKKLYQGFMKKSATVIKRLGPGILKGLAKRYVDDPELQEALNVSAEITAKSLEDQINKQLTVENDIDDFRSSLRKLVKESSSDKPIIFIIDELDRCRPDYAVSVLEQIKHFFAVDGIVFVMAIDKKQLGHAVRGVYGSDKINADEYLRRFIDLEYSIPDPEYKDYCAYLYDYFKFDEFLASDKRMASTELSKEKNHFIDFASSFFSKNKLTLRSLEKIFFRARVAMNLFEEDEYTFPGVYIYLLYLKFSEEGFYKKIIDKRLTINELAAKIEENIDFKQTDNNMYFLLFIEACLLTFYRNYYNLNTSSDSSIDWLLNSDRELQFESGLDKQLVGSLIRNISLTAQNNYSSLSLSHLINKIELTENFVSTDTEK